MGRHKVKRVASTSTTSTNKDDVMKELFWFVDRFNTENEKVLNAEQENLQATTDKLEILRKRGTKGVEADAKRSQLFLQATRPSHRY